MLKIDGRQVHFLLHLDGVLTSHPVEGLEATTDLGFRLSFEGLMIFGWLLYLEGGLALVDCLVESFSLGAQPLRHGVESAALSAHKVTLSFDLLVPMDGWQHGVVAVVGRRQSRWLPLPDHFRSCAHIVGCLITQCPLLQETQF